MSTGIDHRITPAEAINMISQTRGMRFCLHLQVRTYDADDMPRDDRCNAWTYLDLTRKQALDVLGRLDKKNPAMRICINIDDDLIWIG